MTCFHYTPDYIDNHLDLHILRDINLYQEQYPPQHQLVAAYLGAGRFADGYKSTSLKELDVNDENVNDEFFNQLIQNGITESTKIHRIRMQK